MVNGVINQLTPGGPHCNHKKMLNFGPDNGNLAQELVFFVAMGDSSPKIHGEFIEFNGMTMG